MIIGSKTISETSPAYFIADIAANHDGELGRALDLISIAAEAGADAAKFQHFRAEHIVSDRGFREIGAAKSHQSTWKKSVFEVYQDASLPWDWTEALAKRASDEGIHFMTSPYDLGAVDFVDQFVPAFKIGSGDLNWDEELNAVAAKGKPVILATGASTMSEVDHAFGVIRAHGVPVCLMQCNTNYTGRDENFRYLNLRVLDSFRQSFPEAYLGFSDHTPGHSAVLGAIALGAKIIEKHLTDDNSRVGPDHSFSMNPTTWREMITRSRELESALGYSQKSVADNELETRVIQRRGLRYREDFPKGHVISPGDIVALRPAPEESMEPNQIESVLGRPLTDHVTRHQLVSQSQYK